MPAIPLRPFSVGDILDFAFQIYRHDYKLYLLIALVALGPASVFAASAPFPAGDDIATLFPELGKVVLFFVVAVLLQFLATTALVVAMSKRVNDREVSLADSYSVALRKVPAVIGAWVLAFLVLFGIWFASMFVSVGVMIALGVSGIESAAATSPLFVVLPVLAAAVLPSVLWCGSIFAIYPSIVLEDRGPAEAIGRSWRLARGARWRVFGVIVAALVITWVPEWGVAILLVGPQELFTADPAGSIGAGRYWLSSMLSSLAGIVVAPLGAAIILLLYYDRRVRTEAYDLEATAEAMVE